MEVDGKIKLINDLQTFGSGFEKREIVLTTDEKYPQDILIAFKNNSIKLLDDLKVGQDITVSINILGNEYNGKYYVNLNGWQISTAKYKAEGKEVSKKEYKEKIIDLGDNDVTPF